MDHKTRLLYWRHSRFLLPSSFKLKNGSSCVWDSHAQCFSLGEASSAARLACSAGCTRDLAEYSNALPVSFTFILNNSHTKMIIIHCIDGSLCKFWCGENYSEQGSRISRTNEQVMHSDIKWVFGCISGTVWSFLSWLIVTQPTPLMVCQTWWWTGTYWIDIFSHGYYAVFKYHTS